MPAIEFGKRFARSPRARSARLGDEEVLLNLDSRRYFALNATGAAIWARLAEPCGMTELTRVLVEEFDVDESQASADTDALLRELLAEELVRIVDAP